MRNKLFTRRCMLDVFCFDFEFVYRSFVVGIFKEKIYIPTTHIEENKKIKKNKKKIKIK